MIKNKNTIILFAIIGISASAILGFLIYQNNKPKDASVNASMTVIVNVGDDIQSKVNSNSAGTTYIIKSGVHRLQTINPKSGDIFMGESGTILNGSKLLTNFQQSGNTWYVTGQTQEARPKGQCISTHPRCDKPEELYINDVRMHHVANLGDVGTGKWYFDYGADRIYIGDNPSGKKIEASAKERAFSGSATNETIKNFVIEKYSNRAQDGVIQAGEGWLIEHNETRYNHGGGIRINTDVIVRNNYIHHNGQIGMTGGGYNGLVENNEISYNNTAGFIAGWEGGNTKFAHSNGLVVRGNYVHHSIDGPGLWTDIENINTLYENNITVYNEQGEGIKHEINQSVEIRNNFSGYNGVNQNWYWGSQILIQNSRDGDVHNNTVVVGSGYSAGIGIVNQNRGTTTSNPVGIPTGIPRISINNNIYDNDIYMVDSQGKFIGVAGDYQVDNFYLENQASGNTFYGPSGIADAQAWEWGTPKSGGGYDYHKDYNEYKNGPTFGEGSQVITTGYTIPSIPVFTQSVGPDFQVDQAAPVCGNGQVESGEQCDDSNTSNGDGCSMICQNEIEVVENDFENISASTYFLLELENYDVGGQGIGYNDVDAENRGGAYRNDGVDIKEVTGGDYVIGYMATGEWLQYTIDVQTSGTYELLVRYATIEPNVSIQISADGSNFEPVVLPSTLSYDNYALASYELGDLEAGQNVIRLTVTQQYADIDFIKFNLVESSDGLISSIIDPNNPVENQQVICGYIDINFDSQLTLADFARFALVYGKQCSDQPPLEGCGPIDSNRDSQVNLTDFAYFASKYGRNLNCIISND